MSTATTDDSFDSYVVFDCDIGTDDAWALLMLLRAEEYSQKQPAPAPAALGPGRFKLEAVTCVHGNTNVDNASRNALRVLSTVQRLDVPVYKGCNDPIIPRLVHNDELFHGLDGLGDAGEYPAVDESLICEEHAVNAMYRLACQHAGKVDFILCGPLTNFALCINMYGDAFLERVRHIYIMGGNIQAKGNVSKSAEFNFLMDPEAAHVVLGRLKRPAYVLPWEPCIDGEYGLTLDWRFNVLGAVASPAMELLNRAERAVLVPHGFIKWLTCDAMLMAAYLFPSLLIEEHRDYSATVELSGAHTRGQMVLDHPRGLPQDGKTYNVRIIRRLHAAHYCRVISWTGALPGVQIEDLWTGSKEKAETSA